MREYYADQQPRTPPLSHSATFVVVTVLLAAVFVYWLVWTRAYRYTDLRLRNSSYTDCWASLFLV